MRFHNTFTVKWWQANSAIWWCFCFSDDSYFHALFLRGAKIRVLREKDMLQTNVSSVLNSDRPAKHPIELEPISKKTVG
jgi:hypothetical protein